MTWTSLFFLFIGVTFGFFAGAFCKERQFINEWIFKYQEVLEIREELLAELDRAVKARKQNENDNKAD